MRQPKGTKVYDGGEKFFDRYTIIFPGFEMALGLSGDPNKPQGTKGVRKNEADDKGVRGPL